MDLLQFFKLILSITGEYWPWAALIALVIAAYIYGGERLAALVAMLGVVAMVYFKGRRDEKEHSAKIARDIQDKREKAYAKIDARNTSGSDVAERLRKRDY